VGLDQFATIEKAFSASFELVVVDGAGHFVHREAPQLVEQKIITFLAG
jgi:pimeloyl-ACP methyl ester carboxylesterase